MKSSFDDDDPQPLETVEREGMELPPPHETVREDIDAWMDRFHDLGKQAKACGYTVAVVISSYDPLSNSTWRVYGYHGNYYAAIGALRKSLMEMEQE